jgi:hypothetical protein
MGRLQFLQSSTWSPNWAIGFRKHLRLLQIFLRIAPQWSDMVQDGGERKSMSRSTCGLPECGEGALIGTNCLHNGQGNHLDCSTTLPATTHLSSTAGSTAGSPPSSAQWQALSHRPAPSSLSQSPWRRARPPTGSCRSPSRTASGTPGRSCVSGRRPWSPAPGTALSGPGSAQGEAAASRDS